MIDAFWAKWRVPSSGYKKVGVVDNSDAVNPQLIANYFIQSVDTDSGDNITHLKLQKLMYFAQAWYLANINKVLFDEDMQAWAHGPVTPSIWHKYKENRWGSLSLAPIIHDSHRI
jgi:uncharacterized phage-associated protein